MSILVCQFDWIERCLRSRQNTFLGVSTRTLPEVTHGPVGQGTEGGRLSLNMTPVGQGPWTRQKADDREFAHADSWERPGVGATLTPSTAQTETISFRM